MKIKKLFVPLIAGMLTLGPVMSVVENIQTDAATQQFIDDTDGDGQWNIDESQIKVEISDWENVDFKLSNAETSGENGKYSIKINDGINNIPSMSSAAITLKFKCDKMSDDNIANLNLFVEAKDNNGEFWSNNLNSDRGDSLNYKDGIYTVTFNVVTGISENLTFNLQNIVSKTIPEFIEGGIINGTNYYNISVDTPREDLLIRVPLNKDVDSEEYVTPDEYEVWAKRIAVYANSLSCTQDVYREKLFINTCNENLSIPGVCSIERLVQYSPDVMTQIIDKEIKYEENRINWTELHEIAHAYSGENFFNSFNIGFTDEVFTNLRGLTAIQNCDNLHCDNSHENKECNDIGCTNIVYGGYILPYDKIMYQLEDMYKVEEDVSKSYDSSVLWFAVPNRFMNITNGNGWNIDKNNWNEDKAKKNGWDVLETFFNPPVKYLAAENEDVVRTFMAYTGMSYKSDKQGYKQFAMTLYALYDIAKEKGIIINDLSFNEFLEQSFGTYKGRDSIIKEYVTHMISDDLATSDLRIIQQPTDTTAKIGEKLKVIVAATGEDLSYKWFYKDANQKSFNYANVSADNYTTIMTKDCDGRQICCEITDKYGNITQSDIVTLKSKVAVVNQPIDTFAEYGEQIDVKVKATGNGLVYKWYYKDFGKTSFIHTKTFTGDTYTATMNEARDGRQIYCEISDAYGNSVQTNIVTLKSKVAITQQPTDVSAEIGKTISTVVEATGNDLTYQWYFKNKDEPADAKFKKSSITTADYTTVMNEERNGRQVYCVITDKYGNSVQTDTVSLYRNVVITKEPTDINVEIGQKFSIFVEATGKDLTYQWYYKDAGKTTFLYTKTFTGNTYETTMSEARDGRQVYCIITDKFGNSVQTNTVTLKSKVAITQQPTDVSAEYGQKFSAVVEATGKDLTYQWYYKDAGKTTFLYTKTFTGNTYETTMSEARDGRQLYCIITDKYGNRVQTDTVTLKSKVAITQQPTDVSAEHGEWISVSVSATGKNLTYQWYMFDEAFNTWEKIGSNSNIYSFYANYYSNDGCCYFYCIITDEYGNSVQTNTVTLKYKVSITQQPTDVSAEYGEWISLSVNATGKNLTYQWYMFDEAFNTWEKIGLNSDTFSRMAINTEYFYCNITDEYGNSVESDIITVNVY